MFGKSTEKRVAREADKIISLKEDMDAVSWTRVLDIGKLLQEGVDEDERIALAHELMSIAQSNRSLYTRLGIDPAPAPSRVMASGIEVLEGGLAEAAIEERAGQIEERALPSLTAPAAIEQEPVADEPSETDFQAAEVQVERELVAKNDPDEDDFAEAAQAAASEPAPAVEPETAPTSEVEAEEPEAEPASEPEPQPASEPAKKCRFACFRNLYESRDGGLCVFEDEHGHLVAVDASKLA